MRLFIGIDLPNEIKKSLLEFQSKLKIIGIGGSWKSQETFHITIEFLGDLDPHFIPILTKTLTEVARNHESFKLSLRGLGAFPSNDRPHTLWTAVDGGLNELHSLRDDIHCELAKNGFVLEGRRFQPHITLASRLKLDNINLFNVYTHTIGEVTVTKVVLFESRILGGKRNYTDLFRISLKSQPKQ
jgi:RNA 2',3'-cyclic 3'-phosphodiesterase